MALKKLIQHHHCMVSSSRFREPLSWIHDIYRQIDVPADRELAIDATYNLFLS